MFLHRPAARGCWRRLNPSSYLPSAHGFRMRCHSDSSDVGTTDKTLHNNNTRAGVSNEMEVDDSVEWLQPFVAEAVKCGRQTRESASYFEQMLEEQPEFIRGLKEARRLVGNQRPDQFTRYQQGQFAERLTNYVAMSASERLMKAHAEESSSRQFTQHGTPTGENYWMESGNTLASASVPGFIKDDILRDMQKDRQTDSPANYEPREEEWSPSESGETPASCAESVRQQRRKLWSSSDMNLDA